MRLIFMGTTEFSCVVLQQLIDDGYNVVGVVTQPDRPFGRKKVLKAPAVKEMAIKNNIPVCQPERIKNSVEEVLAMEPDCIVTCAYGQIVPKAILEYPKLGCLNVHASLLPKFRGGAPIHKSIIAGEKETGVTLMMMDIGMDSGDMLAKQSVSIDFDDTFGDVEYKLKEVSKVLIHHDFANYLAGKIVPEQQDESQVTYAYAIKREEEFVSFKRDGMDIYNHIRGLIPWPVGYAILDDTNLKIHGVKYIQQSHDYPINKIIDINDEGIHVSVQGGILCLTKVQPAGKPVMKNIDIVNSYAKIWKGKEFI